ncbi:MAG: ATP-dependent helicase, partial [Deltaproteobacteria bacterium]|nr:ATP-dependent helicase [Deltaproteobacteria bacterium]
TLEKALFSSPWACRETIAHRIQRLSRQGKDETRADIQVLEGLDKALADITPERFAKFQVLLDMLQKPGPFQFNGRDSSDRLVIFTERIETLRFLHEHLPPLLKLKDKQATMLHGGLPDTDQQGIVEDFGRQESPLRLLLASDVASEGINLHYLCHRMIHFDIPWSLMVFQQRNGRIDRYGQEREPHISYLTTESVNPTIKGDTRILELLIAKDQEAVRSIGDPSAFMGVYDETEEARLTAQAMEEGLSPEAFEARLAENLPDEFDPLAILLGLADEPLPQAQEPPTANMPTLFPDDHDFFLAGLRALRQQSGLDVHFEVQSESRIIEFTPPPDLEIRLRTLPREVRSSPMIFTDNRRAIQEDIARARAEETAWPRLHFLWGQHPVLSWLEDKLLARFSRHEAPVLALPGKLKPGEHVFIVSGLIPNRKGHPLIQHWFGIHLLGNGFEGHVEFEDIVDRFGLGSGVLANPGRAVDVAPLAKLLPDVVFKAREIMTKQRAAFETRIQPQLKDQLARLDELRRRHDCQIQLYFEGMKLPEHRIRDRRESKYREVQQLFEEYRDWIRNTMTTEDKPYIKICAVLTGV